MRSIPKVNLYNKQIVIPITHTKSSFLLKSSQTKIQLTMLRIRDCQIVHFINKREAHARTQRYQKEKKTKYQNCKKGKQGEKREAGAQPDSEAVFSMGAHGICTVRGQQGSQRGLFRHVQLFIQLAIAFPAA